MAHIRPVRCKRPEQVQSASVIALEPSQARLGIQEVEGGSERAQECICAKVPEAAKPPIWPGRHWPPNHPFSARYEDLAEGKIGAELPLGERKCWAR